MIASLKRAWQSALELGLKLPHAYDPVAKQASFRLLTAYISFLLACISIVALHVHEKLLTASLVSICFYALCMIFYMLKKLTGAKIDLDDRSVSLTNEESQEESEKTS